MKTSSLIGLLVVLAIIAGLLLSLSNIAKQQRVLNVSSYAECVQAGYPVMESYPSQCATPNGRIFVNPEQQASLDSARQPESAACAVGGCSRHVCGEAADMDAMVTTCEYRAEYACYKTALCERQADGHCGWTETAALSTCLANPPAEQ